MPILRCLKSLIPDLERPCTSCGYSLEKGVRIVSVVDIISGCAFTVLWSILLSFVVHHPPEDSTAENILRRKREQLDIDATYKLQLVLLIFLLVFAVVQLFSGFGLYFALAKKNISYLYTWLIISGLAIPATGIVIKIYEMIVVFAYTDELKCVLRAKAIEEFRKTPYWCTVKTQFYPATKSTELPHYEKKTFLVDNSIESIFNTVIRHHL